MWLIAKTDAAREYAVARYLESIGYLCWVPSQITVAYERFTAGPGVTLRRKTPKERPLMPKERPLMPSVVFVASQERLYPPPYPSPSIVRHLNGYWTNAEEFPIIVQCAELDRFRARVEEVNAAEIARIKKAAMGKRKPRKTVKLDPNLADELKAILFGQKEQAA
jgi:hypothetical protein